MTQAAESFSALFAIDLRVPGSGTHPAPRGRTTCLSDNDNLVWDDGSDD